MKREAAAAKLISRLSPKVQVRLAGGASIVRDGQTLDPATQLSLYYVEKRMAGSPGVILDVAKERHMLRRQSLVAGGDPDPVKSVRDLTIDGAQGPIRARLYSTPEFGGPHPLLVFYHGGGFVLGDLDSHDGVCRTLCLHGGVDVLAVDYRLAPEHPFPAAVDDARAAYDWARANAADLGSDPTRIAVGGDSAGGNLAAVTAREVARSLAPPPVAQLLIYPATAMDVKHPSHGLFGEGFFLTSDLMDWFGQQYGGPEQPDPADPRISPIRAEDLSGLAPALVVTAGFDPLRDEGEAYAKALSDAGTYAVVRRFPDLIHGFLSMGGVSRSSRDATLEVAGTLRALVRR
jgi:acetyl esterase